MCVLSCVGPPQAWLINVNLPNDDAHRGEDRLVVHGSGSTAALLGLAERLASVFVAHTRPRAIMLVGSTATDCTDCYSDLDLIAYYDERPSEEHFEAARLQTACTAYTRPSPWVENYRVQGVECEVGHFLITEVEQRLATVCEALDVETTVHKQLIGLIEGQPLHGPELIDAWQARAAAFPEGLRRAMVEHNLQKLFPLWYFEARLAAREAHLWVRHELIQGGFCILGILAGLNRCYFSSFQFKRMHRFVDRLALAPIDLADRLDILSVASPVVAITALEQLVLETLALVGDHMPDANTGVLRHPPGAREQRWSLPH
jgi:hypothetical protein